ncbi:Hpt domain-containing protein [Meridianimarinicoccus sp. RP-17]|uniref:Hpt domain-containing protein n=1 Tax=Meridianimarinicoccus zhengii TaxID=2056810 RepID=UPI000DAD9CE4|nr:Hpt domain-containing protein [Phycocomes zhengii]
MDWNRLDELRTEVGADALGEVLALFLEETDDMAMRLAGGGDPATLGDDLHFMKGAALNLGFDVLADACRAAETALRADGPAAVDVAAILDSYAAAKAELHAREPALLGAA